MSAVDRRLVIEAIGNGFRCETQYVNGLGYWKTLSTTWVLKFPFHIVARVANRPDYRILVRGR